VDELGDDLMSAVPALVEDPMHRAAVLRAGRLVGLLALGAAAALSGTMAP
jgi:hypothetical protein